MQSLPAHMRPERSFQGFTLALQRFWADQGCVILQPYDMEMGAGTFHPATTLRALGPKRWNAAYVQPSRRPKDGRYGENPNRLEHYYQFQVILKPSPPDIQELYLKSLAAIGVDSALHDIRFVEDDWESPTLGAWGLGWEWWCGGMQRPRWRCARQLWRRVPASRAGIFAAQFRILRRRHAVQAIRHGRGSLQKISRCGVEGRRARGTSDGAAGLRPVHQGQSRL